MFGKDKKPVADLAADNAALTKKVAELEAAVADKNAAYDALEKKYIAADEERDSAVKQAHKHELAAAEAIGANKQSEAIIDNLLNRAAAATQAAAPLMLTDPE